MLAFVGAWLLVRAVVDLNAAPIMLDMLGIWILGCACLITESRHCVTPPASLIALNGLPAPTKCTFLITGLLRTIIFTLPIKMIYGKLGKRNLQNQ
jgi:hypothetical protein